MAKSRLGGGELSNKDQISTSNSIGSDTQISERVPGRGSKISSAIRALPLLTGLLAGGAVLGDSQKASAELSANGYQAPITPNFVKPGVIYRGATKVDTTGPDTIVHFATDTSANNSDIYKTVCADHDLSKCNEPILVDEVNTGLDEFDITFGGGKAYVVSNDGETNRIYQYNVNGSVIDKTSKKEVTGIVETGGYPTSTFYEKAKNRLYAIAYQDQSKIYRSTVPSDGKSWSWESVDSCNSLETTSVFIDGDKMLIGSGVTTTGQFDIKFFDFNGETCEGEVMDFDSLPNDVKFNLTGPQVPVAVDGLNRFWFDDGGTRKVAYPKTGGQAGAGGSSGAGGSTQAGAGGAAGEGGAGGNPAGGNGGQGGQGGAGAAGESQGGAGGISGAAGEAGNGGEANAAGANQAGESGAGGAGQAGAAGKPPEGGAAGAGAEGGASGAGAGGAGAAGSPEGAGGSGAGQGGSGQGAESGAGGAGQAGAAGKPPEACDPKMNTQVTTSGKAEIGECVGTQIKVNIAGEAKVTMNGKVFEFAADSSGTLTLAYPNSFLIGKGLKPKIFFENPDDNNKGILKYEDGLPMGAEGTETEFHYLNNHPNLVGIRMKEGAFRIYNPSCDAFKLGAQMGVTGTTLINHCDPQKFVVEGEKMNLNPENADKQNLGLAKASGLPGAIFYFTTDGSPIPDPEKDDGGQSEHANNKVIVKDDGCVCSVPGGQVDTRNSIASILAVGGFLAAAARRSARKNSVEV